MLKNRYVLILSESKKESKEIERMYKNIAIKNQEIFIKDLIEYLTTNIVNDNFDWNLGNLLLYVDHSMVLEIIKEVPSEKILFLYDSVGITWLFGELQENDSFIENFLKNVIKYSRNSEAWWQAAFSIEKRTTENAISILKRNLKQYRNLSLDEYLNSLYNKKSIIGVLNNANNTTIKNKIYPFLLQKLDSANEKELVNILWLFGRLRLINDKILNKITKLFSNENEKLVYSILWALAQSPNESYRKIFLEYISSSQSSIRKISIRGIGTIGNFEDLSLLEELIISEKDEKVIFEISKAIYSIKNVRSKYKNLLRKKYIVNENGLIGDDTDKWYADPSIYNIFSEAEDLENLCFNIIVKKFMTNHDKVINPIDLATGTGKILRLISNNILYDGVLYGVDSSKEMLIYLEKMIDRQKKYILNIQLENSTIKESKIKDKSNFIISSFGFPSKISNIENCVEELEKVYSLLTDDGVFATIGWDESFSDELSEFWYKYIPDDTICNDFEDWKNKKKNSIVSPRNCNLTWLKRGLKIPLQFSNLEDSVNVMGHLFGTDAANEIIQNEKIEWEMSFGITYNTKQELSDIITQLRNCII